MTELHLDKHLPDHWAIGDKEVNFGLALVHLEVTYTTLVDISLDKASHMASPHQGGGKCNEAIFFGGRRTRNS